FANLPLSRLFVTDTTGKIRVEALGVESWAYENNSYLVKRRYRITTPEGTFEYSIPVRSNEGEAAGEVRKWTVEAFKVQPTNTNLTPLGQGLFVLRRQSAESLKRWMMELNTGAIYDL